MWEFFDIRSPFFQPLYRRIIVVLALAGWGLFEARSGNTYWAALFLAVAVYCGYVFFVNWHFKEDDDE